MAERNWIRFFEREAPSYMENVFTKNTPAEVEFLIRELGMSEGDTVLDIGCGTGRHSVELSRRGFRCTGIDQSPDMLEIARRTAGEAGVEVEFIEGDASSTSLDRRFDHAVCICEGAFCLMEPGTDPLPYHTGILRNIHGMLKPGGNLLLNALSALRLIRLSSDEEVASGKFDPVTTSVMEIHPGPDGIDIRGVEKGFMPAELTSLLESNGFEVLHLWGGTAGSWNKQPLSLDEYEIMVVARREP